MSTKKKKKRPHYKQTFHISLLNLNTVIAEKKKKKPARPCFEARVKALYSFCSNTVHFCLMSQFYNKGKSIKWIGFVLYISNYTLECIFISAFSCFGTQHASHLHPRSPLSVTQAAGSVSHAEQVSAQMPHFLAGLNVASGWWRKVRLNIKIVHWWLTNLLRVSPDWYTRLINVWHWQSGHRT